jgi:hypothetical protein
MARFGLVQELKRFDTMLKDVGKSEQTPLSGLDAPNFLYSSRIVLATVDVFEEFVYALVIRHVVRVSRIAQLTEGEEGRGDVLRRVIIECRGNNVLILSVGSVI